VHGKDKFEGVVARGVDFGVVEVLGVPDFGVPDFEVLPDFWDFWTGVVDLETGFEFESGLEPGFEPGFDPELDPEFDLNFEDPEFEFIFDANFSAVA